MDGLSEEDEVTVHTEGRDDRCSCLGSKGFLHGAAGSEEDHESDAPVAAMVDPRQAQGIPR
ncbi:hypothetical protein EBN03_08505 [Nocardia stercoris]|uniref:Uncharacterized protein n=1 Tax=Nocardia stercoris TaxID=2483361 RepID=A0A3M2L6S4_9NOCA|nr:hypothetical protein EBN03_08505 [Nocardia stercoris]